MLVGYSSKNARRRSLIESKRPSVTKLSQQWIETSDDESEDVFEVLTDVQQFLCQLNSKILNPKERNAKQNLAEKNSFSEKAKKKQVGLDFMCKEQISIFFIA